MLGTEQFIGGMLNGFVGAKNKAQQAGFLNDYRKAMTDHLKTQAKLDEQKINLSMMQEQLKQPIYKLIAQAAQQGLGGAPNPQGSVSANQPNVPAVAQVSPSIPEMVAQLPPSIPEMVAQLPPSIPEMVAQGQMPPGFRGTTGLSASNNNPGNLVYAGQPGAVPGQGHGASPFAKFPTMEAGWNALLNQVVLDQSRGHTLGSFINKYAPPSENDTASYITNMANRLGVSPNTPLANIPTADVAKGLAFFESSTKVGGLPTTPPALPTQPVQNAFPQQSLITGRKLLEGFLKKEFGMEPDDAKVVSYGDHKLVTDKAGNPKFIIAGQGKMEMVDVTLPDGSTVRRPQLIPPSPLPGGIPVYNMAGQAVSNMAGPAGIMTKPPEVNWQTRTTPGGGKEQFPLPKAQAGMPSFQTEPPKGETSSEAGRIQLAQSGVIAFDQLNKLIFDPNTGKSNWGNLAASFGPGIPWTQGKQIKSLILKASDAIVRAATGAALNQQELRAYADMYAPSVFDNEQTVQSKMQGLQTFLNGYLEKMDPTGAQRLRVGNVQVTPPPMTMTPPKVNTNKPNYYYNPKTGKLEAGR